MVENSGPDRTGPIVYFLGPTRPDRTEPNQTEPDLFPNKSESIIRNIIYNTVLLYTLSLRILSSDCDCILSRDLVWYKFRTGPDPGKERSGPDRCNVRSVKFHGLSLMKVGISVQGSHHLDFDKVAQRCQPSLGTIREISQIP